MLRFEIYSVIPVANVESEDQIQKLIKINTIRANH